MIAYVPVLFAIAGLLIHAFSKNEKIKPLGRDIFVCAFLVCMFAAAGHTFKVF